ncbi:unnamed protein product [Musa hybrid cultivar]
MAGDPSPDGLNGRRKRKAGRPAAEDSTGGGAVASSSQRRAAVDDAVVLLRGALEFRRRTGLMPRPSNMPALYESVRGSLRSPVSQDQAYNKLRHLRHRLSHPVASGHGSHDDLLYELAAELWSAGVEEKYEKEDNKKQKDNEVEEESKDAETEGDDDLDKKQGRNGDEQRGGPESYPYLVHAAAEHWKAHSLSNSSLEAGLKLLNPLKAKALEDRWKKLVEDEMKFQADWFMACRDIFALLNQSHQVSLLSVWGSEKRMRIIGEAWRSVKPYLVMVFLQLGYAGMFVVSVASLKLGMSHYVLVVFSSALYNILPAVTFVSAIVLSRMEREKIKERRSQAKIVGTLVTVIGAMIMILYKGPVDSTPLFTGGLLGSDVLGSCVLLAGGGDEGERPCVRDGLQPTLHGHCGCDGVYHSRGGDLFGEGDWCSHHSDWSVCSYMGDEQ